MKAYTIRCGECDAKLKVEKPELIGKRVKCPKCSARILVVSEEEAKAASADTLERPLETSSASDEGADDATVGFTDFDDIESLLKTQKQTEKAAPSSTRKETAGATKRTASESPSTVSKESSVEAKSNAALDPKLLDPNAAWQSAETATRQRWMLIVTVASLVGLVAIGAVIWGINELSSSDPIAENQQPAESNPEGETEEATNPTDEGDPAEADVEPETPTTEPETPAETPAETQEPDTDPSPDTETETPTDPVTPMPSDPLAGPPGFEGPGTPDVLRPFDTVLSDLDSLGAIMVESPFDKARVLAERELSRAYRVRLGRDEVFMAKPATRDPKVADQLALELQAIELPAMSLEKYLELISNLTGLAIKVEPDALQAASQTMNSPIEVKSEAIKVADLLTSSLSTLGLGWEQSGDVLVVSLPNPSTKETRKYSLEGLGQITTDQPELAAEVLRVMIEPESWTAEAGNSVAVEFAELVVIQSPLNHWRIEQFMNQWRERVAGVSADAAASAESEEASESEVARELLAKRVTLEHLQPVSLRVLARELASQVSGTILIDWVALAKEGWTADTSLTCSLNNETLGIGLQDTLRPAALSFRVIDANTLQITTRNDLLAASDVEFFDLRGLQEAGIAPAEVQGQLPQVFRAVSAADPSKTFFYDPANGVLISSLAQPQQRALAKFLTAWERFTLLAKK